MSQKMDHFAHSSRMLCDFYLKSLNLRLFVHLVVKSFK